MREYQKKYHMNIGFAYLSIFVYILQNLRVCRLAVLTEGFGKKLFYVEIFNFAWLYKNNKKEDHKSIKVYGYIDI